MTTPTSDERIRIGLNGFGRIGRSVFRAALDHPRVDIVAINDIMDADDMRYLLAYDSVMGRLADVTLDGEELVVGENRTTVLAERDPTELPWDEMDVDVALECTGIFRSYDDAKLHVDAGAEKAIISAPPKGDRDVLQIVYGVNHDEYEDEPVVSNASCTTNSVAPVAKVLDDTFGIEQGLLTTVHAYTSTQQLIDGPAGKRRRGRAAAENIIPTTTGAAVATTEVLPQLAGKLDGMAMRVPVPNGSITDFTVSLAEPVGRDAVNAAIREAATSDLAGVLGVTDEEIVSRDILGLPYSSMVDLPSTMSIGDGFVKVLAWYDNEYGFANRLLDLSEYIVTGESDPTRREPLAAA